VNHEHRKTFNEAWAETLQVILSRGIDVSPRGKITRELPQHTITVDMRRPVLTVSLRKLSYPFMAAEAYWVLSGDDTVAGIAPWNKHIAGYSDDGEHFYGAYGPPIKEQLDYVTSTLLRDKDTRQAGLTIWRRCPLPTKDVPCTIAIFASLRREELNLHVFMRSNDAWLGLPYDAFNFSMLGHLITARVNAAYKAVNPKSMDVTPGTLHLTAASSHLYQEDQHDARLCIMGDAPRMTLKTPAFTYREEDRLMQLLQDLRDTRPGDSLRWWEA
jgi:thymidylate synthase